MAMSPEEIQALIDQSREKLAAERQRMDEQIKNVQENPAVTAKEATETLPSDAKSDQSVLDYAIDEGKTIGLSAIGVGELALEFGTGMFGAFTGTVAGTGRELWDNDTMSKHGEFFMDSFQNYTEAMTYQPRTEQGQAISKWAQELFGKFSDWGSQAGDAAFKATGDPLIATAVETAISGAPVYVPAIGGKLLKRAKENKAKLSRAEELKGKIQEDGAIDTTTIDQSMLPDPLISENPVNTSTAQGISGMKKLLNDIIPDNQKIENARLQKQLDKKLKDLEKRERDRNQLSLDLEEFPAIKDKIAEPHPNKGVDLTDAEIAKRAKEVDAIQDASIKESKGRRLPTKGQVSDKLMETIFDASAGLRKRILNGLDKGQNKLLEAYYNRVAGATPNAQLIYQKYEAKVYQGLNSIEKTDLDKLIQSKRTIQIDYNAKLKNELPPRHPGGKTGVDHVARIAQMEKELGKKTFDVLNSRANEFFKATNNILQDLYVEGLISKKQFLSMKKDIYSPRKVIERLDPINDSLSTDVLSFSTEGKRVKINDSGLQELNKGTIDLMELDSKTLLQEYTVRAVNRIWRNQANVKLLEWVKDNPKNGWARIAKEGEKAGKLGRIDAYIDGKKTSILMEKKFALQWVGNTYVMGHGFSNFMRTVSGQWIMKPLTTGMNPEFALKLFAVDIMHAFFSTDVFSKSLPIYTLQLGRNLGITMKDAFFKGERFQDFIKEGGGMNFLTHQGTDVFGGKGIIRNNTKLRQFKEVASFLNEGFEVWVRLAIREQAINNYKMANKKAGLGETITPDQLIEATNKAREYIDFSQGGTISKAIDTAIPYFNSVLQATRTLARGGVRNPKRFAYQVAELSAIASSWVMYQELMYPEVMRDVSEDEKAKFWIFPTGRSIRNQQGEVQHAYFKIRKDNMIAAMINPFEMAMRNYITGFVPDDQLLAYYKSSLPVIPTDISTPTGAAIHSFAYNHDFWGNPVWNDPDLDVGLSPEDETKVASLRGAASSTFFRDVGQALGISPERLQESIEKVAPSNGYLDAFGWAYKKMVNDMEDPFLAQDVFEQQMAKAPFLRKMLTLTHPATKVIEEAKRPRTISQVYRKRQRDKLDSLIINNTNQSVVRQWITQQPPEDQERLFISYDTKTELAKIFNGKQDMSLNIPGPFFWNHVASEIKDNKQKAEVLYWEWRSMPTPEDRNSFMRIANRLSLNKQIWPAVTLRYFEELKQKWGTSGIMNKEDGGVYRRFGKRHYMQEHQFESDEVYQKRLEKLNLVNPSMLPNP